MPLLLVQKKTSEMLLIFTTCLITTIYSVNSNLAPLIQMNDGYKVPAMGFGTWLGQGVPIVDDTMERAVSAAIDAGYRHIDAASCYGTEDQVGRAVRQKIKEGVISRDDIFVTTKLWNDKHARSEVVPQLKRSLKDLGLDYVDLYLIHWPVGQFLNGTFYSTDYVETWMGMIEARQLGLTRSIGVSNFNSSQIDRLVRCTAVKPAMLQVEVNLNMQQAELLSYCKRQNIAVAAFRPFGSLFPASAQPGAPPPREDDDILQSIADKHHKAVPQVALRYLVELGVIPIPKSVKKSRIESNFEVFDFQLNWGEKYQLRRFERHYRTLALPHLKESPYYPFSDVE